MTFSVSKSFLSTTVGLALDRGLIRSVDDLVGPYMGPIVPAQRSSVGAEGGMNPLGSTGTISLFDSEHNRRITWNHMLRQTSDWEGTLWGKPDWADRPDRDASTWLTRDRNEPGSAYEYNDTRVNLLALAVMNVWRRPLPQVLREHVMDPIGASPSWRWMGYDNSWVVLDGQLMQAVSGGGHWGGGMFINARDMARFGLLTIRDGRWKDQQILSQQWLTMARTPTPAQRGYGFMNFFLNRYDSGTATSFSHVGNGTNVIYCDPENDIVIVLRWIRDPAIDQVIAKVMAAMG
jgi:CubicO group peptidase (beta-lactamase class C family)